MFNKIKEFFTGKKATVTEAPYKVEAPAPKVEVVPAGTESSVAAIVAQPPVETTPKVEAKPKAPAKPKVEAKPKAPAKPRAPRKPKSEAAK